VEEVEIERKGAVLVITPVSRQGLGGIAKALAAFPADFMADGRERHEQKARRWTKTR
jgi:virulence-associated protein VagC